MINFNDLVPASRPVAGTVVKEDLVYDTEKKNFILGSHIRKALGDNSLAYYRYVLNGRTMIVLIGESEGVLYKARVRKSDNTRMSRGATFSNAAFKETIEELYPDVTKFKLVSQEISSIDTPAWLVETVNESIPNLFFDTDDEEAAEREAEDFVTQYTLND